MRGVWADDADVGGEAAVDGGLVGELTAVEAAEASGETKMLSRDGGEADAASILKGDGDALYIELRD